MVRTFLLIVSFSAVAGAQAPTGAQAEAEDAAKALFAEGNRLLAEGDAEGALGMFRSAYARYPNPKLLLNIGTALRRIGRNAEAAEAYEQYLRESGFDTKKAAEVATILGELEPLVGRLRIEVSPAGALVTVDGKTIGPLSQPRVVRVEPGDHTVGAALQGYESAAVSLRIAAGEEQPVALTLTALPAPEPAIAPAPSTGWPPPSGEVQVEARVVPGDLSHANHLGLTARSETDLRTTGTGSAAGATFGVGRWVEVSAMGLFQKEVGLRVAGSLFILPDSPWKPFVRLGVPMFFADGTTAAGVHAGGGLMWDFMPRWGVGLDGAVEHYPNAPAGVYKTAGVLGAGLHVRIF